MKATLVTRNGDRATVRLTPCWLARWLGAHVVDVGLVRAGVDGWGTEATERPLSHVAHGALMLHALDFVPVLALPRGAVALESSEAP